MTSWLLVGVVVALLAIYVWIEALRRKTSVEGFTTVDLPTLTAQRQALQWEGERRYNDLARLQNPRTIVSSDAVAAAVQQTVPVPNPGAPSLLSLLGFGQLSGADDGSNKQGAGVEQTGMVQEKINFCESLKSLDCKQLDDPRLAECGICLDGGKDSKGHFHRGGMYISSADQISANERATAAGAPAAYAPTVGTCPPKNFVLMKENCQAREAQLKCIRAGAPTDSNPCGQCYGAAPGGFQGLLYTVPPGQQKPMNYTAILNVNHPGTGNSGGASLIVLDQNGNQLGSMPPSNTPLYDPRQIALTLYEGQQITIKVFGPPQIWCGWLSNSAGTRIVSLDIGMQMISPTGAFEIAGDKNSGPVRGAYQMWSDAWSWLDSTPNTVLWYMRRNEVIPGAITQAWYGTTPPNVANPIGYDVTAVVQMASTAGTQQYTISNTLMSQATGAPAGGDPAVDIVKHLWIYYDNGNTTILTEGQTISGNQIGGTVQLAITVPATLADPLLKDDLAACPTGPMILTPVGAGLMSSHSCYTAKGTFNPVPYCLQELFQAAGGTQQGSAFPNTQAQATALVQNDSTGAPSMDATVAYLNNLGNITQTGLDSSGNMVPFATYQNAMQMMLGIKPTNPCEGPAQNTGPQSPECLDYLYRTSGNPGQDSMGVDPSTLPYAFCAANGSIAPLNADGSVNQGNVSLANQYGSASAIRSFYQGVYNMTQDNSNFENQAQAMGQCYGATILPPPADPTACPAPNPTDWQCYTPEILQAPEVFQITGDGGSYAFTSAQASTVCAQAGARLATPDEITAAQAAGAQWCSCGWAADGTAYYPMQQGGLPGCGGPGTVSCGNQAQKNAVACFGVKPPPGTNNVLSFSSITGSWNQPQPGSGISDTAVPAIRQVASNGSPTSKIECASTDGQNCYMFGSASACQAWAANPSSNAAIGTTAMTATTGPMATNWSSGGQIIRNSDTGGIFWVDQDNVAHQISSCIPCWDGYNVCNNISQTQPGSAFDPVNGIYIQGPDFRCGHDGVIDQMLRARA